MATIGQLKAILTLDASRFRRGLSRAQATLASAGRKMKAAGRNLTTKLTAPLAAIGGIGAKMASDLEASMARIEGLVGLSRDTVQGFKDDFIRLSEQTGQSAKDLSDSMFFITSNLFRGKNATDLLKASAKGAAAGLGNMKQLARSTASAMNAFGKDSLNAKEAVSTMLATFKKGSIQSLPGLTRAFSRVGSTAAQAGLSMKETSAAIAAMTLQGTKASTAGRQLRQVLNKLVNPSKQSKKAFKEFGLNIERVQNMLGRGKLVEALTLIKSQVGGNITEISKVIPRMRALTGVLQLVGNSADQTREIFAALRNETGQSLDNALKAVEKTAKFKFFVAFQKIKNSIRSIGEKILPAFINSIQKVAEIVKNVTKRFLKLDDSTQQLIIRIATFAAALGPALIILGGLTLIAASAVGALASIGSGFLALSPIIATVVGSIIEFKDTFIGTIKATAKNIKAVLPAIKNFIINTVKVIKDFFIGVVRGIQNSKLDEEIKSLKKTGIALFRTIKKRSVPALESLRKTAKDAGKGLGKFLGNTLADVLDKIQDIVTTVIEKWPEIKTKIKTTASVIRGTVEATWEIIKGVIASSIILIVGVVDAGMSLLNGNVTKALLKLGTTFKAIFDRIIQAIKNAWNDMLKNLANKTKQFLAHDLPRMGIDVVGEILTAGQIESLTFNPIKNPAGTSKRGRQLLNQRKLAKGVKEGMKGAQKALGIPQITKKTNKLQKEFNNQMKKLGARTKDLAKTSGTNVEIGSVKMEGDPNAITRRDMKKQRRQMERGIMELIAENTKRGPTDPEKIKQELIRKGELDPDEVD